MVIVMEELITQLRQEFASVNSDVCNSLEFTGEDAFIDYLTARDIAADRMHMCDDTTLKEIWLMGSYEEKQEILKEAFPEGEKYYG